LVQRFDKLLTNGWQHEYFDVSVFHQGQTKPNFRFVPGNYGNCFIASFLVIELDRRKLFHPAPQRIGVNAAIGEFFHRASSP
jgi:hypothetical protein